jgi:BioD-like phosphotransacetylase family protein
MLIRDRDEDLLKLIMEKYKALEGECDLIVCAGSDFTGPAAALEFDFNAKIANNRLPEGLVKFRVKKARSGYLLYRPMRSAR